jgi:hypothetical protein
LLSLPSCIQHRFFWGVSWKHQAIEDLDYFVTRRELTCTVYHTFVIWDLFYFLITGLATTHLCYLGPEIDFLITGFSYIRFSYNRKTLSNNKEQFCRDPAGPFLIPGFSYIRLSYIRSALYISKSYLLPCDSF